MIDLKSLVVGRKDNLFPLISLFGCTTGRTNDSVEEVPLAGNYFPMIYGSTEPLETTHTIFFSKDENPL